MELKSKKVKVKKGRFKVKHAVRVVSVGCQCD